jgi:uncharacterized protein (TIGR02271 family)
MEGKDDPRPPGSLTDESSSEASPASATGTRGAEVLQLFAEEAAVSRRTVETGRVRVATVTHTRDHLVDELLARTNVEVERVPVGRMIDAIPPIKDDDDLMVIPIVEETVVVERRLVLKEELHIRRRRTTERFRETVPLRYQTAQITRIPAQKAAADTEAVARSIPKRNPEDT